MDISKITYRSLDGRLYIQNWQCYFCEVERTHRYDCVTTPDGPILLEGDYCYLLDANFEIIWESGILIKDLELLAELVQDKMYNYYGYQYEKIPRFKIGLESLEWFRELKRQEAEDARLKSEEDLRKGQTRERGNLIKHIKRGDLYVMKEGNEWIEMGLAEKDRKSLWMTLWREQEICFLFADSNIGKSIYALQIAFHIAKEQKVLYFDYEMDYKEFQSRYTGESGDACVLPKGFIRCEPEKDIFLDKHADELLLMEIEKLVVKTEAKVIIIDNLTYVSKNAQSGASVSVLMYRLKMLQRRHSLSILVLAHTPKRDMRKPLTQNDLAGSKKLFNFADSGFAIGQSVKDSNLQYLKQLKARGGRIEYGGENVILLERVFTDNWLHFEIIGYEPEKDHLKETKQEELARLRLEVEKMLNDGLSQRDVSIILKLSKSQVCRLAQKG